ncbi:MAG: hypothetical protein K8R24_10345, partial [Mycobacterium sp.]|nr:hypothetical protein [Mycobacterium sp.]
MRIAVQFAAALLVAGCTQGPPRTTALTPITPSRAASSPAQSSAPSTPSSTSATSSDAAAPRGGAPITAAISWVEAATPLDAADFAVALRGGTTTPLGDDVAFTTPSGTGCMTDVKRG